MTELILAFLMWISAETELAVPPAPAVVMVSQEEIARRAFGALLAREAGAPALYDKESGTVYLREGWDARDLYSRATLLHELVHHVQDFNRVPAACPAARERLAYRLTLLWLEQQGVEDPHAILNIDEFTIAVLSMCPESE